VVLVVADDGRGPAWTPRHGFGLRGMRERLQLVGGDMALTRGDAGGAVLRATFPLVLVTSRPPLGSRAAGTALRGHAHTPRSSRG